MFTYDTLKIARGNKGLARTKPYPGDAGFDIYCSETTTIPPRSYKAIPTTAKVELPAGTFGMLVGRSSIAARGCLTHLGTIDNQYRGIVAPFIFNPTDTPITLDEGDRVAQLLILPLLDIQIEEIDQLTPSIRGESGIGSSGK